MNNSRLTCWLLSIDQTSAGSSSSLQLVRRQSRELRQFRSMLFGSRCYFFAFPLAVCLRFQKKKQEFVFALSRIAHSICREYKVKQMKTRRRNQSTCSACAAAQQNVKGAERAGRVARFQVVSGAWCPCLIQVLVFGSKYRTGVAAAAAAQIGAKLRQNEEGDTRSVGEA